MYLILAIEQKEGQEFMLFEIMYYKINYFKRFENDHPDF